MRYLFTLIMTTASAQMGAEHYFPTDYEASRARFRTSCAANQKGGADFCRSFAVPTAAGGDLTVDAGYFTRGGRHLLVMQSGTHGPESPAGAAIQDLAFRQHLDALLGRGIDVLMIHAFNPWGFKNGRRVDERNVNLNRNFVRTAAEYGRINEGYRKLRAVFEPVEVVTHALIEYLKTDRRLLWQLTLDRFSKRAISEAMNMGQYESPEGLNYGGTAPAPQVEILTKLLRPLAAKYAKVLFIDWHTGLGERGVLHWMVGEGSTSTLTEDFKPMLARLAPHGVKATVVSEDPNFFRTTGGVEVFAAGLFAPGTAVVGVTAEFGTLGAGTLAQLRSAHRMIVENQAWFRGCADPVTCARVRRDFQELFNPVDPAWRSGVLEQAHQVLSALASDFGSSGNLRK